MTDFLGGWACGRITICRITRSRARTPAHGIGAFWTPARVTATRADPSMSWVPQSSACQIAMAPDAALTVPAVLPIRPAFDTALSSNGKTTDSDSVNRGSNPRGASIVSLQICRCPRYRRGSAIDRADAAVDPIRDHHMRIAAASLQKRRREFRPGRTKCRPVQVLRERRPPVSRSTGSSPATARHAWRMPY